MIKAFILSRKIHRLLVLVMFFLTMFMTITGLAMKYVGVASTLGFDSNLVRYLHNQMSVLFAIGLVFMAVTGIIMYLYPILRSKNTNQT